MESDAYLVAILRQTFCRHLHAFSLTSCTPKLLYFSGEKFGAQKIKMYLSGLMDIRRGPHQFGFGRLDG